MTDTIETTEDETTDAPAVQADWSLVDHPIVADVLGKVSAAIGRKYAGTTSADDQHQEASIHVALNSGRVRDYLSNDLLGQRALYRWLHQELTKGLRGEVSYQEHAVPELRAGEGD